MYLTTGGGRVVALEPETAKEIWTYDVKDGAPATRGLEFWAGDKQSPATVFFGTSSGKLFALNAKTGKPIPGLRQRRHRGYEARRIERPGEFLVRAVLSADRLQERRDHRRARAGRAERRRGRRYARRGMYTPASCSGRSIRCRGPGETGSDTWKGDDWKNRSGTNVWGLFTIDTERGILYMPFGEPTTDYWGGDRPGQESVRHVAGGRGCAHRQAEMVFPGGASRHLGLRSVRAADSFRRDPEREEDSRGRTTDQERICVHPEPRHRRADLRRGRAKGSRGRCLARRPGVAHAADSAEAARAGPHQLQARGSGDGHAGAQQILHGTVRQHSRRLARRSGSSRITPPRPA